MINPHTLPTLSATQPLVFYELNEVPWRVVDWYVARRPGSALARLLRGALTFTTVTRDEGELHPWTTWPSLHRGAYNTAHGIRFINQDLSTARAFPPIWESAVAAGLTVGVFGSLQSYPLPVAVERDYAFYVPDTFAPRENSFPVSCVPFQRFNLRQTRQDGAQAQNVRLGGSVMADVMGMLRGGLRLRTLGRLLAHIARERINPLFRARRSVLQAPVAFDFYYTLMTAQQPKFSTFFTNHVAGMMHRYWRQSFPQDFPNATREPGDAFHETSIEFAMDIADEQIERLMDYVVARNGMLAIASSMGQEAIDRGAYSGEWRITDVEKFVRSAGWLHPYENVLAMQPDFNFKFDDAAQAQAFAAQMQRLTDSQGASIWKRAQVTANTVNMGLSPSLTALHDGVVRVPSAVAGDESKGLSELGIERLQRDPGTGYHQPKGTLLFWGGQVTPNDARTEIELSAVRGMLTDALGMPTSQTGPDSVAAVSA
jgi:hypothetical protein